MVFCSSACRSLLKFLDFSQFVRELAQLFGHDGVQRDVRAGDGLLGAQHAEFELVAGESQGGGAVAVRGVLGNVGQASTPTSRALWAFSW